MVSLIVIVMTAAIVLLQAAEASQDTLRLGGSGYAGLTVSFSPEIADSQQETLILRLQDLFRRASEALSKATSGRASFGQVEFVLPKNWDTSRWTAVKNADIKKRHTTNDGQRTTFVVKSRDEAFSYLPMAVQAGGCGKGGIEIQLSEKFMTESTSDALVLKQMAGKLLASQFIKYRFGTFDEQGFLGDTLYPLYWSIPGQDDSGIMVTSCAATKSGHVLDTITTRNVTSSGEICSLVINPATGSPAESRCLPQADVSSFANDQIVSSILGHVEIPSAEKVCDSHTHNGKAPTKQNNLCHGKSVQEIMDSHPDFSNKRELISSSAPQEVMFNYVQESEPRLAFIVDASHLFKKAIYSSLIRFCSGLAAGRQLLMLDMRDDTSVHASPIWTEQKDGLSSIWGRDTASANNGLCLKCAIDEFVSKLEMVGGTSSDLIIVSPGNIADSGDTLENIARVLKDRSVHLRVVVFPYVRSTNLDKLRKLVLKVQGSIHLVAADSELRSLNLNSVSVLAGRSSNRFTAPTSHLVPNSGITSKLLLFDVFDSFETDTMNIRIARQQIMSSDSGSVFKFQVDNSLIDKDIQLVTFFTSSSGTEIESIPSYFLRSGSERLTTKSSEYKESSHKFQVPLESRSPGTWTLHYTSENKSESLIAVAYAQVKKSNYRQKSPITVKCHLSDPQVSVKPSGDSSPPILFVSLSQNMNQRVQNARVEVTLTDDLGQVIPGGHHLRMTDDGLGFPDVTQGDGIYSLYLSMLSDIGFYGVQVNVMSDEHLTLIHPGFGQDQESGSKVNPQPCCGSIVPILQDSKVSKIEHLQRYHDCGQIYLETKFDSRSFVGHVTHVQVEAIDTYARKLTIAWSPPASNTYSYIELRQFSESQFDRIRSDFDSGLYQDRFTSEPWTGKRKKTIVDISNDQGGNYYFAFKVYGSGGSSSSSAASYVSNIVMAHFPAADRESNNQDLNGYITQESAGKFHGLEPWQLVAIVGGSIIILVLLIFCVLCICMARKRNAKDDEQEVQKTSFGNKNSNVPHQSNLTIQTTMGSRNVSSEKINHGMNLGHHGHHQLSNYHQMSTIDGSELQTISPVQSWDANVILGHYNKVQEAKVRKETPPVMKVEEAVLVRDGGGSSGSSNSENVESATSGSQESYDDNAFMAATQNHGHQQWQLGHYDHPSSMASYPPPPALGGDPGQQYLLAGNMYSPAMYQADPYYHEPSQWQNDGQGVAMGMSQPWQPQDSPSLAYSHPHLTSGSSWQQASSHLVDNSHLVDHNSHLVHHSYQDQDQRSITTPSDSDTGANYDPRSFTSQRRSTAAVSQV